MMFGLSLRVFFHFYIGLLIVLIIPTTLSETVTIQTEVGSKDKLSFPNSTCQVASGTRLCENFRAQEVHDGKNCSCLCPQDANTFGFDGEYCNCLSNSILYGGCPKFSQNDRNVILQRNSSTKHLLSSKNCSLEVLSRRNNGSWMTVKDLTGIITFSQTGIFNGSFVYVLKVSNAIEDFQGTLYNVIVKCPNQNGTCSLLKLPRKITCPLMLSVTTTLAPRNSTSPINMTNSSGKNFNSNALNEGELAAIIVSCVTFLAILLLLLFLWIRRKRNQAIKNERKESRQQMTGDQDAVKRNSKSVVFSRPKRASTQRKDSANLGFEPDAGSSCDDNYEDPDYDLPIDEKHSVISDFVNRLKRPLSMKIPIQKQQEKEGKLENESDEYQIMEKLENPDNIEHTAFYENTNGPVEDQPKPEAKQPSYKKMWRQKLRKKEKESGGQDTRDDKRKGNDSEEIPKKGGGDKIELENFYENNEVIRENLRHEGPSKNRDNHSNDVPEEEEGPPPPPRSTSLERVLDGPKNHRPTPSPRMRNKLQNLQENDAFNYEIDNETETDPSELYENTRKSSFPMPIPRTKK